MVRRSRLLLFYSKEKFFVSQASASHLPDVYFAELRLHYFCTHNTVTTKLSIALCFFQMMERLESSIFQTKDKLCTAMQDVERTVGDAILKLDARLHSLEARPLNECSMVRRPFLEILRIDLVWLYVLTYAILDELLILSVSLISDKQYRIRRDHSTA